MCGFKSKTPSPPPKPKKPGWVEGDSNIPKAIVFYQALGTTKSICRVKAAVYAEWKELTPKNFQTILSQLTGGDEFDLNNVQLL